MKPIIEATNIYGREVVNVAPGLRLIRDEPNRNFTVWLDNLMIPHVEVGFGDKTDALFVLIDQRLGVHIPFDDPQMIANTFYMLANCMAVAAGFSCFGVDSQVINPYRRYLGPGEIS